MTEKQRTNPTFVTYGTYVHNVGGLSSDMKVLGFTNANVKHLKHCSGNNFNGSLLKLMKTITE